jgi:hypothetical protein
MNKKECKPVHDWQSFKRLGRGGWHEAKSNSLMLVLYLFNRGVLLMNRHDKQCKSCHVERKTTVFEPKAWKEKAKPCLIQASPKQDGPFVPGLVFINQIDLKARAQIAKGDMIWILLACLALLQLE